MNRSHVFKRAPPVPAVTPAYITKDLVQVLEVLTPRAGTKEEVEISDTEPIASYSWLDEKTPTILVPGLPPIWADVNPTRVYQDAGNTYVDQNSARMTSGFSPLTPMFAAIVDLGQTTRLRNIDLVTDRNSLRKLYRWATGVADRDFRIDVELVGNTCLFTRREEADIEFIDTFRGYGQEYKDVATMLSKGSENATGHHRIIALKFGGVRVLLRFEVDACTAAHDTTGEDDDDDDDDALTSAFANLSTGPKVSLPGLTVRRAAKRTMVPQSTLVELKTRAGHKELDWADTYPQLYLSQTPHLYLAKHDRGLFRPVEKHELGDPTLLRHAVLAKAGMAKLRDVLLQVLESVRLEGEGVGLSLICKAGELALWQRKEGTGRVVGKDIAALFDEL